MIPVSNPSNNHYIEHGWLPYIDNGYEQVPEGKKAIKSEIVIENNIAIQKYETRDLTPEELNDNRKTLNATRIQFHLGLKFYEWNGSKLLDQVNVVVNSLPEPHKTIAQTKLDEANEYKRLDGMLIQLAQAMGMTDKDIDDFFNFCINESWVQ